MKTIIPIGIVVLVLIAATFYFEYFRYQGESKTRIEGSGTFEVTEIDISSKISGRVAELPFDEGSFVRKNDLLVKLEYNELKAQKNSASANLTNAEENLTRIRTLYDAGSASKQSLDNADANYKVAKSELDLINANIQDAVITSPIDGVVLNKNLEIGETAFPGSAIMTMADIRKPWIKIYVDEKKLGLVKLGQEARIKVDSFPGTNFSGVVINIANQAEFTPKTIQTKDERVKLMFAVKISVDNPELKLKPGMPADVEIITEASN